MNPFYKIPFPEFREYSKMSKEEVEKEANQLGEAIRHHDYLYYVKNKPVISDSKYDELFRRLQNLEEAYPELQSDFSPTSRIGAPPLEEFRKREHHAPMLSLDSSDQQEEVQQFIKRMKEEAGEKAEFMVEPKFDGLSVEIVYDHGSFSYAATRGDGTTGEDISENVKTIRSVPLKLRNENHYPGKLSIRGEIIMEKEGFRQMNRNRIEKGEEPFANARNAASGIIRQFDSKKVADKPLEVFFYEVLSNSSKKFHSHFEMLRQLEAMGLRTCRENRKCSSFSEIKDHYRKLDEKRDQLAYDIDGMVIKLDNRSIRSGIGTRRRTPRWAYAWKFTPKKETTRLLDIVVQVGRTGILTPVALLEPVEVGGVTVSRATLHNEEEVNKKDIRPGDTVQVIRAGDVIPEIAHRVKKKGSNRGKPFSMPDHTG